MSNVSTNDIAGVDEADNGAFAEYFHSYLQQVVTLHRATLQKLLFESDELRPELAELFEDIGNTYLSLSESIARHHLQKKLSEVEEQLDARIEPALRRVEAELGIEPRVRWAEHFTKPVKD